MNTREQRLAFLKDCPEVVLEEVLFAMGILPDIPWDRASPAERVIEVAKYFDGMPDGFWTRFWSKVESRRQQMMSEPIPADRLPPVPPGPFKLSGLPQVDAELRGRERELGILDQCWDTAQPYVIGLIGEGGQGKTILVHNWLKQFRRDQLRGATCVYVHSFYRHGTNEGGNADEFLEATLRFLDDRSPSEGTPADKAARLAKHLRAYRTLLILDGVEPLQGSQENAARLNDLGLKVLLQELVCGFNGLCVVTSRRPLADLTTSDEGSYLAEAIVPVTNEAGAEIIVGAGVTPSAEVARAAQDFGVHGLSIQLLGRFIAQFLGGDASRRQEVPELATDRGTLEEVLAAFDSRLPAEQRCMLRLVGLFDRPAKLQVIRCFWEAPPVVGVTEPIEGFTKERWFRLAEQLRDLGLLWPRDEAEFDAIDAHPRVRAFFGERLREENEAAWRDCHRHIYQRLTATTEHQPDTLAGLQPLYQAVTHGCLAGLHEQACVDVYRDRILRGETSGGFYSFTSLGATGSDLAALSCFFVAPWHTLVPGFLPSTRAFVFGDTASHLRAMGRLTEARDAFVRSLKEYTQEASWEGAAWAANNVSESMLLLGNLVGAVCYGKKAVPLADKSGSTFQRMACRCKLAEALHQAGRNDEARLRFGDADTIEKLAKNGGPGLRSWWSFRHCDLLLSKAERAAWQIMLRSGSGGKSGALARTCSDMAKRATKMLGAGRGHGIPLEIGLHHLTLARTRLYAELLLGASTGGSRLFEIDSALTQLRGAAQMHWLPRGLLTRGWVRFLSGDEQGCRADLNEAWEVAERGPMPLYMADILLTRARLFGGIRVESKGIKGGGGSSFAKASADKGWEVGGGGTGKHAGRIKGGGYPWGSPREDLAEARRLIEKHGYHRRDEELADAEEAAEHWAGGGEGGDCVIA